MAPVTRMTRGKYAMASCKTKLRETRNIVTNERGNYKRNEDTLKYKSPLMKRLQTSDFKFKVSEVRRRLLWERYLSKSLLSTEKCLHAVSTCFVENIESCNRVTFLQLAWGKQKLMELCA